MAAIDFYSSYCLPPAFDVRGFLAQLRNQLFHHPETLQKIPEDVFLNDYLAFADRIEPDLQRQVELFRARANLNIAAFLIKLGLGNSEDLWRVLVEAERAMAQFTAWEQGPVFPAPPVNG